MLRSVFLAILVTVTTNTAALAHHGLAAYDMSKSVTIKGVVTEFSFINPHAAIYLVVKDDKSNTEKWMVEADSPNNLARAGWTRNTIKPGQEISVVGNQMKDGSKILRLQKILLADGKELRPREGNEY
ncbi:MAG TPA: DUF6152 family protein [Candidatus Acidoferrales bacterium]|jgi:hypothetical protein|nr:DUF6152 family protein [Candidatus Acidoferrales bacterium]